MVNGKFCIDSVPDNGIDSSLFFDAVKGIPFAIIFDFSDIKTYIQLFTDNPDFYSKGIASRIPGLELSKSTDTDSKGNFFIGSFLRINIDYEKDPKSSNSVFEDCFNLGIEKGIFGVLFFPVKKEEIEYSSREIERSLTAIDTKETRSINARMASYNSSYSTQHDIFYNSDDRIALNYILNSINKAILKGSSIYKTLFFTDAESSYIKHYLSSKFLILESSSISNAGMPDIISYLSKSKQIALGSDELGYLLDFEGMHRISHVIETGISPSKGDICIGSIMKHAVLDTKINLSLDRSILNLGVLISGLPGTGKTHESMAIVEEAIKVGVPTVVISSTKEWDGFAYDNNLYCLKLLNDKVPINFFSCPNRSNRDKFWRDLAMLLASASDAGPYRRPLEKCMLDAFRRVYKSTANPNPADAIDEIIKSIIDMHGKRTNTGVKYTKHGENIKAALENLIDLLSNAEYSSQFGVMFEDLISRGIVFDASETGFGMKKLIYSLILNQFYSIISSMDESGDSSLRMLLVVEEAELVFKDDDSPAVEDMKTRIQDFRKKGVGLIFITHGALEVDADLRRLLQVKLYFRQSSDMAPYAVKDLLSDIDNDRLVSKIKHMPSGIFGLSTISKEGYNRYPIDLEFLRSLFYNYKGSIDGKLIEKYIDSKGLSIPEYVYENLKFEGYPKLSSNDSQSEKNYKILQKIRRLAVKYLGNKIYDVLFDKLEYQFYLIKGRVYDLELTTENEVSLLHLPIKPSGEGISLEFVLKYGKLDIAEKKSNFGKSLKDS